MKSDGNAARIFALERPDPALWKLYVIRAILSGPGMLIAFPYLYFRYHTLRYRFDDEGIHMKVGILFRREVNLTYARIQDIHLRSGFIQRWLGLADVQVQTASGNAGAELVIEGFREFEQIRDFLYMRMRGARGGEQAAGTHSGVPAIAGEAPTGMVEVLSQIRDELRRTREALERKGGGDV
ncbi:PH domain-containing protein [Luteolibacter soli]|uniref:PH domain-containing protein n=1 Tax=Luteolibacter soli TaxID=3135280 RepID=A0ABU9ASG8_9BACT